jgi:S1-C subfamily serine protease
MSLIPPQFLTAVASLEIEVKDAQGKIDMRPVATGFFYGRKVQQESGPGAGQYRVWLITNRHVVEDRAGNWMKEISVRFNFIDPIQLAKHYKYALLDPAGSPVWLRHKDPLVDIAVLPVNGPALVSLGIEFYFFQDDSDVFLAKDFASEGITTGDGVFVLGYPLGLRGGPRNRVIVRHGIIARVDEELLKQHYYFIDASAFPGNSGGPVLHRPEVVAIQGTKANSRSALVGVISAGMTYNDIAVSQQTGEPRVVFTEQTGLVRVVPIESVNEVIDDYLTQMPAPTPQAPMGP